MLTSTLRLLTFTLRLLTSTRNCGRNSKVKVNRLSCGELIRYNDRRIIMDSKNKRLENIVSVLPIIKVVNGQLQVSLSTISTPITPTNKEE